MKISKELARKIIPAPIEDFSFFKQQYKKRDTSRGQKIVRLAPSPTGLPHFGMLFTATIDEQIARQSKGKFLLRIEDTDKSREIENGIGEIIHTLKKFKVTYDEGPISDTESIGDYGPYIQSERRDIYLASARELLENNFAYPCFCTHEELEKMRESQEKENVKPGYYGKWARCRNLVDKEIEKKLDEKSSYTIRFRAPENPEKLTYHDLIKGDLELPGNDVDYVIIKSAEDGLGLPVYHLAAMLDDHLQGINLIIRGDEWLASFPLHYQIIKAFGWDVPAIAHIAPILKIDGNGKRKLSKRKDPEAAVSYYEKEGIRPEIMRAYILRLADSGFEEWRKENQKAPLIDFPLSLENMSGSAGAIFDPIKLKDIAKEEISLLESSVIYEETKIWAKEFDPEFYTIFTKDPEYSTAILSIERTGDKVRKDLSKWSEVKDLFGYFYDEIYDLLVIQHETESIKNKEGFQEIINAYLGDNKNKKTKDEWLLDLRTTAERLGFAPNMKAFKTNPDQYKGHIGDVSMVIRLVLSGKTNTPDLYEMISVMGKERVEKRLKKFI